jgi:CRP-like cAMP-binding protein
MSFGYFLNYLQKNFDTTHLNEVQLKSHVHDFKYNKKVELLQSGEICEHFYFIKTGLVRTYEIKNDREDTLNFYGPDHFFSSFRSFLHQIPSSEGIICESEVRGVRISYTELNSLRKSNPYFNDLSIQIYEKLIIDLYHELNTYRTSTAKERYQLINSSLPELSITSLQKDIASFLGISNTHYSTLKKDALRKR